MEQKKTPSRRGDALREHILLCARDVFLEMGFERASMDVVAARAGTSKRSLYSHFESKEKLFNAFLELRREMFLGKLKTPADYPGTPAQSLILFCARYLEIMIYDKSIQLCRVNIAETTRFPGGAEQYFNVAFTEVQAMVSDHLRRTAGFSRRAAADAAEALLARVLYPRFLRALFGIDPLTSTFDPYALPPGFDLKPIRKAVTASIRGE